MSFLTQTQLAADFQFQRRVTACVQGQAMIYKDDARGDFVALSESVLRVEATSLPSFFAMLAAAPGFADAVDPEADGTIDSSVITDPQILSAVQADWPIVAALFYDSDGTPKS